MRAEGVSSTQALYEFNYMNTMLRVLEISGFSGLWAKGEKIALPQVSLTLSEWQPLSQHPSGQQIFDLLCPGGKDD